MGTFITIAMRSSNPTNSPPLLLTTNFDTLACANQSIHATIAPTVTICSSTHKLARVNGTAVFGSRNMLVGLPLATINYNWASTISPNKRLVLKLTHEACKMNENHHPRVWQPKYVYSWITKSCQVNVA
jgi:hypothetical protein